MKRYGKVETGSILVGEYVDVGEHPTHQRSARGETVRPISLTEFIDFEDHCKPDHLRDRNNDD